MKFEEAIKMVGKQYIQEEIKCREENDITIKLPIRFKIRMWWMFKKEKFKIILSIIFYGSLQYAMVHFF